MPSAPPGGESGETLSHGAAPCALPSRSARRDRRWAGLTWIAHNVVHHQSVPNEQQEQREGGEGGTVEFSGRWVVGPATRPYSVRLLARHHVLHKPGDDREDRAASATADDLADDGSDIEAAAGRACDRWHRG